MSKFLLILSIAFLMSCVNAHDGFIKNKKWRMVKESVTTVDKTGTSTSNKLKDFNIMDYLYFDDAAKLSIVCYGETTRYTYDIKDSILTFKNPKAFYKTGEYRIKVSTKDSLVLSRTEIWGNDESLKVIAVLHMAAVKE